MLTSTEWFPTSHSNVRYGVLALIVGTFSVTTLAMVIAVPFGLGAAIYEGLRRTAPMTARTTARVAEFERR